MRNKDLIGMDEVATILGLTKTGTHYVVVNSGKFIEPHAVFNAPNGETRIYRRADVKRWARLNGYPKKGQET